MNFKDLKKKAKSALKKNYFMSILIVFLLSTIINNNYNYSTELISNSEEAIEIHSLIYNKEEKEIHLNKLNENNKYENNEKMKGVIQPIVSRFSITTSPLYNFSYSLKQFFYKHDTKAGVYSLLIAFLSFLIFIFIKLVLEIGKNRFFLESRIYSKTNMIRLLFPYKVRGTLHLSIILFIKRIYQTLWSITIVMGFVKAYEYKMIPYILAENPSIKRKEAFRMSKEMINGHKKEALLLDLSLIGWKILGLATLGISNILFYDAYKESIYAEYYSEIREKTKKKLTNGKLLNDSALFENKKEEEIYPEKELPVPVKKITINTDYDQAYSIRNCILLFFTAAFIGYSWEVFLHIVVDGAFVNRGILIGPWLPIYGFGALLILIILKPFRNKPFLFFIMAMLLAGIVEYTTSYLLEAQFHMKWWDYTGYFINLNGRICLEGLLVFGLGGSVITYFFAPFMNSLFNKIKNKVVIIICFILVSLFGADVIYSFNHPNTGEGITDY